MAGKRTHVNWNLEADQTLLLTIIEHHQLSVDCQGVADKWPKGDIVPTPRAIREHLFKLRRAAKNPKSPAATASPQTPKEKRKGKGNVEKTPASSSGRPGSKRTRDSNDSAIADAGVMCDNFSYAGYDLDDNDFEESPTKRLARAISKSTSPCTSSSVNNGGFESTTFAQNEFLNAGMSGGVAENMSGSTEVHWGDSVGYGGYPPTTMSTSHEYADSHFSLLHSQVKEDEGHTPPRKLFIKQEEDDF